MQSKNIECISDAVCPLNPFLSSSIMHIDFLLQLTEFRKSAKCKEENHATASSAYELVLAAT